MSELASFTTEKVMINGTKCRKIIKINNCKIQAELPEEYLNERPYFYFMKNRSMSRHDVDSCGKAVWTSETEEHDGLVTRFTQRVPLNGWNLILTESSVFTEEAFQDILKNLKECGERLARIAAWSGSEEVVI